MMKLKEFKILSEQQEQYPFSLKLCKRKPYAEPLMYDTSCFKGVIPSWQYHEMKTGMNNADNE